MINAIIEVCKNAKKRDWSTAEAKIPARDPQGPSEKSHSLSLFLGVVMSFEVLGTASHPPFWEHVAT